MGKRLRIAFVGLGAMAEHLYHGIAEDGRFEIAGICCRTRNKLQKRSEEWNAPGFTDYEELFDTVPLDAVVVSTPPSSHKDVVLSAIRHGINVFCEKPPAMNSAEALEMMNAANEKDILLMYGFLSRFSKRYEEAKRIIESGELGKILLARLSTIRRAGVPGSWFVSRKFSGGGPVIDFGSHSLDLARFLLGGKKPLSAYAVCFPCVQNLHDIVGGPPKWMPQSAVDCVPDVEDMAIAIVRFEDDITVSLFLSNAAHVRENSKTIQFLGDKAGLSIDPVFEMNGVKDHRLSDINMESDVPGFDYQGSIDAEISHFADCLLSGTECKATAYDGWVLMKIIDAIYKSAETGKAEEIKV